MLTAFLGILLAAALAGTLLAVAAASRAPRDPAAVHWSTTLPVLGGSAPPTHAWSRFHARFYPMALVLIAFEMEMMFMYPWAVVFVEEGLVALVEMGVFLSMLGLGVLYAWREGGLGWQ